jgi:hypothetical protein
MAEKDISSLINELNLDSTQPHHTFIQPLKEDDVYKPKTHTRHCSQPGCPRLRDDYTSPQQNRTPTHHSRQERLALKANNSANTTELSSSTKVNFDSAPKLDIQSASAEAVAANDPPPSQVKPSHVYIVQIMWPSEEVEGVYYSSKNANSRAMEYLNTQRGINASDISEKRGRFGQATMTSKVVKRMWTHTGTL